VLFSDIDGLYDANPRENTDAKIIPLVRELTPEICAMAGGSGSEHGTGGMVTKLHAAEIVMKAGVEMVIANGSDMDKLYDIAAGKNVGTRFLPSEGVRA
ncbi:MAG: hypothetical protein PUB69_04315, partial [Desulfovibrionaceae bacterium]|nr:hypothetical protein [Desulfovibrionaceae bacterium]